MKNLREAATWMWERRGKNIYWRPGVLTDKNLGDPTAPRLNLVEAESVFRFLEDEKLIFPVERDDGTAYLMNEVRQREWESLLRDVSPMHRFVVRPLILIFKNAWTVVIWFASVVIAAFAGGFFSAWMQSIFK